MKNTMITEIMKNVKYPPRLLKGLDDIENLQEYLKNNKVYSFNLRLTNDCNYNCVYCGTSKKRGTHCTGELNTNEYIQLIEEAKKIGARTVILGGNGEPTLTKNLQYILKKIHELEMIPILFTNAYIFGDDKLCQKIHSMSGVDFLNIIDETDTSLIISCETTNEDLYNEIVGKKNAYKVFMRSIDRIKNTKLVHKLEYKGCTLCRIAISAVCMPSNYNNRYDLADFAHSLNGLLVMKLPSLHGAAKDNIQKMFDKSDYSSVSKEINKITDKKATLQIMNLACVAWTLGISVSNLGEYMICMTNEDNPYGEGVNVRNTSLSELIGRRQELQKLKSTICPVKDIYYAE